MYRRQYIATAGLSAAGVYDLIGATVADSDNDEDGGTHSVTVALDTIATGLEMPLDISFFSEEGRRYIATQPGEILIHDSGEGMRDEPLLDLSDEIVMGYEMGLLGVELHPNFRSNRRLFVRYSSSPREGTPDDYKHTSVLAEFEVDEAGTRVVPDSERTVLEIPQPGKIHNSGDILFGPDGYLYVPTGDGSGIGGGGIFHPEDWYDANPDGGNGQDTSEFLLGGILRIDVDNDPTRPPNVNNSLNDGHSESAGYAVPSDNPLVDKANHRDEYYAWGLRNPWRTSFDDGNYFVGDVGHSGWEMVYHVEKGGNYGWNVKEGSHCFDPENPNDHPEECPDETPKDVRSGEPLLDPIIDYPNESPSEGEINGIAVTGGYVYRGSAIPQLEGQYIFGDLTPNGRLFAGIPPNGWSSDERWSAAIIELADDLGELRSFGQDDDGELYAIGDAGIHRIYPTG